MAKDKDNEFRMMGLATVSTRTSTRGRRFCGRPATRCWGKWVSTILCWRSPSSSKTWPSTTSTSSSGSLPERRLLQGVLYRAMGIPTDMFTVMFALGRLPGWIAHLKELRDDPSSRINRPRQIYTGPTVRDYTPLAER
ncbi:MAG: hypothetical protein CM1200mP2_26960 [Planctomycetaceae bacterium]|nr:MAG: hypothetical protein CM1200mP2_26960 [Planctomycetaceae bacterium]